MDRIPLYTDIDNLAEIFSMDAKSADFLSLKHLISKESNLIICESEENALQNPFYATIATLLAEGDIIVDYRKDDEDFLDPPFKTNLHHHFKDPRSILWSYDEERIKEAKGKTGVLMGAVGEEIEVFDKLNFSKETVKGNRILTIGKNFQTYSDLEPFILPFNEIIINDSYLFLPDQDNWTVEGYIENNFKPLMRTLLKKVRNKVNIVICTFVNEHSQNRFPYFDQEEERNKKIGFSSLYEMCSNFLKDLLGGSRFKLWIVISPQRRKARHDRYFLTNYQWVESPAGLTYFDDQGNFSSRGEAIHLYSILNDDARKDLMPVVQQNLQQMVLDPVKKTHPHRIYGIDNGNSYFLNFENNE